MTIKSLLIVDIFCVHPGWQRLRRGRLSLQSFLLHESSRPGKRSFIIGTRNLTDHITAIEASSKSAKTRRPLNILTKNVQITLGPCQTPKLQIGQSDNLASSRRSESRLNNCHILHRILQWRWHFSESAHCQGKLIGLNRVLVTKLELDDSRSAS